MSESSTRLAGEGQKSHPETDSLGPQKLTGSDSLASRGGSSAPTPTLDALPTQEEFARLVTDATSRAVIVEKLGAQPVVPDAASEAARRQFEELNAAKNRARYSREALLRWYERAAAQAEQGAADTKRLDWLETFMLANGDRHEAAWRVLSHHADGSNHLHGYEAKSFGEGRTVRAAIDAARASADPTVEDMHHDLYEDAGGSPRASACTTTTEDANK